MSLTALLIVAAATYGATRFVVVDSLIQTPRNALIVRLWPWVHLRTESPSVATNRQRHENLGGSVPDNAEGWRGKFAELLACSYCMGWWIGLTMFALYGLDGLGRVAVEAWAIRGLHAAFLDWIRK